MTGRNILPVLAGILAVLIIICTAVYFVKVNKEEEKRFEEEINTEYSRIETIYIRQKDEYLDDVKEDWKGADFYENATQTKENENLTREQKASSLKDILGQFESYDDGLIKEQDKIVSDAYKEIKGKYEKEFLLDGEKEIIDQHEKNVDSYIESYKFKSAEKEIEHYKTLEENIMNDTENPSNYTAKTILEGDEFMPETISFAADSSSYTDSGKAMDADHFTLVEQVGQEGEKEYIDVSVKDMKIVGGEARYLLSFDTNKPDDYKSDRGYILHVRNQEGTKGFTASQGINPQKLVKKAAADYMEKFVRAFNADCGKNSRTFSELKTCLEEGSAAYKDYEDLPSSPSVVTEAIEDSSDEVVTISDDNKYVEFKAVFTYYIQRIRPYSTIKETAKEKDFFENGSRKNFILFEDYILYTEDKGETYKGQKFSDSSEYVVYEHLEEKETFRIRMEDNQSLGPIYDHENDNSTVTLVEAMEYRVNNKEKIYTEGDVYGDPDFDKDDTDDGEEDDGGFGDSDN